MEIAILGHMGRDEALAERLQEHKLHIIGEWRNPGLVAKAETTGGSYHVIDSVSNVDRISDIVKSLSPDMFLTNFDNALAAGVVDAVKSKLGKSDLLIPCPDRSASRIEWDKFYLRQIIDEVDPKYNPINFMAKTPNQVNEAVEYFSNLGMEIAVKPRNLTGGKGVKVMGKHFMSFDEGRDYALKVINDGNQSGVEIQEKLEGHEFTLQIFTDGKTMVKPPSTYDYPYREDGDTGPGTGGMGAFSMIDGLMPFISESDYDEAIALMKEVLLKLKEKGHDYKGVLYPTFFKTKKGLKIVEINARGGEPELINVVDLIDDGVDLGEALRLIALGELAEDSIKYKKLASALVYLVSPDYGYRTGNTYNFSIDVAIAEANKSRVRFAAAEQVGPNEYRSVKTSRVIGISSIDVTPWVARQNVYDAIRDGFGHPLTLEYRRQVADQAYVKALGRS